MVHLSLLSGLLTQTTTKHRVQFDSGRCLRRRLNTCQCRACIDACPHNALQLAGHQIRFTPDRCQGCMLCTTRCPNDALGPDVDFSALISKMPEHDQEIIFTCTRQRYFSSDEVVLPCIGMLSTEALLLIGAKKIAPIVQFDITGCPSCPNNKAITAFQKTFNLVTSRATSWLQSEFLLINGDAVQDSRDATTRRAFLQSFKTITSKHMAQNRIRAHSARSRTGRSVTSRRSLIIQAAQQFQGEQQRMFLQHTAYRISIKKDCTPCNRCSGICPTGALKKIKTHGTNNILCRPERCSGCGLCAQFCPSNSITLHPASLLPF